MHVVHVQNTQGVKSRCLRIVFRAYSLATPGKPTSSMSAVLTTSSASRTAPYVQMNGLLKFSFIHEL